MKARDAMVPIGPYLRPDEGIKEFVAALESMRDHQDTRWVRTLPVLDIQSELVGMLSMTDILKAVYPGYLSTTELSPFTWDGMLESMAAQAAGKKVADLMTSPVITVLVDHPLMECVDHMLKHGISTLPVVDHGGKIVGMLHKSTIFAIIADAMLSAPGNS
jgi:CBS domain-containing protein